MSAANRQRVRAWLNAYEADPFDPEDLIAAERTVIRAADARGCAHLGDAIRAVTDYLRTRDLLVEDAQLPSLRLLEGGIGREALRAAARIGELPDEAPAAAGGGSAAPPQGSVAANEWAGPQTVKEWAKVFGLGRNTMGARLRDGEVRNKRLNRRSYYVHRSDLPAQQ